MAVIHVYKDNVHDLRATLAPDNGSTAEVFGYWAAGDGGGGLYIYDSTSAEPPNQGTVIAPDSKWTGSAYNNGRWLLRIHGSVTAKQFGAVGLETSDPKTLYDAANGGAKVFASEAEVRAVYAASLGSPFSGLLYSATDASCDLMDWAGLQKGIEWCAAKGVQFQVPSGVYYGRKPLWLGNDSYFAADEKNDKSADEMGLAVIGLNGNSREEADGQVANYRLTNDCTNRFAFTLVATPPVGYEAVLRLRFGGDEAFSSILNLGGTVADLLDVVQTACDAISSGKWTVSAAPGTSTSDGLTTKTVFFTVRLSASSHLSPAFVGEIIPVLNSNHNLVSNYVRCLPDCGIVSFRRSAGNSYRFENFTLKGNPENGDYTRLASFGILFPTTQFFGHIVEMTTVSYADTAVGLLQGTGANGEQLRIDRLHAIPVRRMLYTNAPQAFHQEFLGWNGQLLNKDSHGVSPTLTDLVFAEFDDATSPGYGANFYNAGATFSDSSHPESDGTLIAVRRGTGTVQFVGGRFEHTVRLFNYDADSPQGPNNNMDVVLQGVEFTVVGGGSRRLVEGEPIDGVTPSDATATQYGLLVESCAFESFYSLDHPEYGDIVLESLPIDRARIVFEKCRFLGVRSIQQRSIRAAFRRCYKNDFISAGANDSPLREFTNEPQTPGDRTQSLRNAWQDTPWIQTGPRVNVLKNSDLVGQGTGLNESTGITWNLSGDWSLAPVGPSTKLGGFAKWGGLTSGDAALSDFNPGPESFFVSLLSGTTLRNTLSAIDLNDGAATVVTYQALVRVSGKVRFALVKSTDTGVVYDEMVLDQSTDVQKSPWTLVTLRLQLQSAQGIGANPMLLIGNAAASGAVRLQLMWQQAWWGRDGNSTYPLQGGLANAGQRRYVSGSVVQGTYPWGVNSPSVKAADRFQLPLLDTNPDTGEAAKMGWKSPSSITAGSYDLQDGEVYYDAWQKSVLAQMAAEWYVAHQPERVLKDPANNITWEPGNEKNILYTTATSKTLNLRTDASKVALGTVLRVVLLDNETGYTVTVKAGTPQIVLNQGQAAEFVFWVDGSTPKWLVTQIASGAVLG